MDHMEPCTGDVKKKRREKTEEGVVTTLPSFLCVSLLQSLPSPSSSSLRLGILFVSIYVHTYIQYIHYIVTILLRNQFMTPLLGLGFESWFATPTPLCVSFFFFSLKNTPYVYCSTHFSFVPQLSRCIA